MSSLAILFAAVLVPAFPNIASAAPVWDIHVDGNGAGPGVTINREAALDGNGNLYSAISIGDTAGVLHLSTAGVILGTWTVSEYAYAWGIAVASQSVYLAVHSTGTFDFQFVQFTSTGGVAVVGQKTPNRGSYRGIVRVESDGSVYLAGGSLRKFALSGTLIWETFLGSASIGSVALGSGGVVYVVGAQGGYTHAARLDSAGTVVWNATYTSVNPAGGSAAVVDSGGNLYLAGSNGDLVLMKINPSGTLLWARTWDSGKPDIVDAMALDSGGNVVIAGGAEEKTSDNYDSMAWRYDPQGNLLNAMRIPGNLYDIAYGLAVDSADALYMSGLTYTSQGRVLKTSFPSLPTPAGCESVHDVWAGAPSAIGGALASVPTSLNSETCVVVRDSATYSEQVTVQNFTPNGFRLRVLADPTLSTRPVISPPPGATAAFNVLSASVSVEGFAIRPTTSLLRGISVSSPHTMVSSVSIEDSGFVTNIGIKFDGGIQVGTFTGLSFAPSVGINVDASSAAAGSRVTMSGWSGGHAGSPFEVDPLQVVDWVGEPPISTGPLAALSSASVTASWVSPFPAGTLYTVQVATAAGFTGTLVTSATLNVSATAYGLAPNTSYYVRVAPNSSGPFTSLGSTVTLAAPPALSALVSVTTQSVRFAWDQNGNPPGTAYQATISTMPTFAPQTPGAWSVDATSVTISGLSPFATYYVRVRARSRTGTATAYDVTLTTRTNPRDIELALSWGTQTGSHPCAARWGDYDNDGLLDFAAAHCGNSDYINRVYRNDGAGGFTLVWSSTESEVTRGVAWGDYDNDGDLDLAWGNDDSGSVPSARVYRNDGGGAFALVWVSSHADDNKELAWGDYDNDGRLDLLAANEDTQPPSKTRVYRNMGGGSFISAWAAPDGPGYQSAAWGDYDRDGRLDILAGTFGAPAKYTRVYRNKGGGFALVWSSTQTGLAESVRWADFDQDGFLDFLTLGNPSGAAFRSYRFDGSTFTHAAGLATSLDRRLALGDLDSDGDLDAATQQLGSGSSGANGAFRNDGTGRFGAVWSSTHGFSGVGAVDLGDMDGDGRPDLLAVGADCCSTPGHPTLRVYRNVAVAGNTAPAAPSAGFSAFYSGSTGTLSLRWGAGGDAETPAAGLLYAVRAGTAPGASNILSDVLPPGLGSFAHPEHVSGAQLGRDVVVSLPVGTTVYWSVRTLDGGGRRGAPSIEQTLALVSTRTAPAGCAVVVDVGAGAYPSIGAGLAAVPASLTAETCVVVRDAATYAEQVTVQGIANNGHRLRLVADPALAAQPAVAPPPGSTAAFHIMNDSVAVEGFAILPGSFDSPYALLSSSSDVIIDSITLTYFGYFDGVRVASRTIISNSTLALSTRSTGGFLTEKCALNLTGTFNQVVRTTVTTIAGPTLGSALRVGGSSNLISRSYFASAELRIGSIERGSVGNRIEFSTFTRNPSYLLGEYGLDISGSSNTVTDSYVYASTAIYMQESTGTVIQSRFLIATHSGASAIFLHHENMGVTVSSCTLRGGAAGAAVEVFGGSLWPGQRGEFSLTNVAIAGAAVGVKIGTAAAEAALVLSSVTFSALSQGATAILLKGSVLKSTFTAVSFVDASIAVNVDALGLLAGSRITVRDWSGMRGGPDFETDPQGAVDWIYASTLTVLPASAVSTASLTVNWGAFFPTGTTYYARISTDAAFAGTVASSDTRNAFATFGGRTPNTAYYARVATAPAGPFTPLGSTVTLAAPPALSALVAVTTQSVRFGWDLNGNPPDTEFQATLSTMPTFTPETPGGWSAGAASATVSGLTPMTTYYVRIRARSRTGTATAYDAVLSTRTHPRDVELLPSWGTQTGSHPCAARWGDYDNDGRLDFAAAHCGNSDYINRVYRNDGAGGFTLVWSSTESEVTRGVAWGDYDNDGDMDLAWGNDDSGSVPNARVYRNDGGGAFTLVWVSSHVDDNRELHWGDYDNDGRLDLLAVNDAFFSPSRTRVYRNLGGGAFGSAWASPEANGFSSGAWGDYDDDGRLDVLAGGRGAPAQYTRVYRNTGSGFAQVWASTETGLGEAVRWSDLDGDGRLDFLTLDGDIEYRLRTYRYDGSTFTLSASASVSLDDRLSLGDLDADGDLDAATQRLGSGLSGANGAFQNDGTGRFAAVWASTHGFSGVGAVDLGDMDGDGRPDLLAAGADCCSTPGHPTLRVYRNAGLSGNAAPTPPSAFAASYDSSSQVLSLRWDAGGDDHTPAAGLRYAVRAGTAPGTANLLSDALPPTVGSFPHPQRVSASQLGRDLSVALAPGTTVYWSVRALDGGTSQGAPSSEQPFTVPSFPVTAAFTSPVRRLLPGATEASPLGDAASSAVDVELVDAGGSVTSSSWAFHVVMVNAADSPTLRAGTDPSRPVAAGPDWTLVGPSDPPLSVSIAPGQTRARFYVWDTAVGTKTLQAVVARQDGFTMPTVTQAVVVETGLRPAPFLDVFSSSLTARWSSDFATGTVYAAQLSTAPDFSGTLSSSGTLALAASFSGLNPGTTYYARVATSPAGPFTALGSTRTVFEPVAGCATTLFVRQSGGAHCTSLRDCVDLIPSTPLDGDFCVAVLDAADYFHFAVRGKSPNGHRIVIGGVPGGPRPTVRGDSMEAVTIAVQNASVTLRNLSVYFPTARAVVVSSPNARVEDVYIDQWAPAAALTVSSWTTVTRASVAFTSPFGGAGILVTGVGSVISQSTTSGNGRIELVDAASNTLSGLYAANDACYGLTLERAHNNTVRRSTVTGVGSGCAGLKVFGGAGNLFEDLAVSGSGTAGAWFDTYAGANARNTVRRSTITGGAAGSAAVHLQGVEAFTLEDSRVHAGAGDALRLETGSFAIVRSTLTSSAEGRTALYAETTSGPPSQTSVTGSYLQGSTGAWLNGVVGVVLADSVLVATRSAGDGLRLWSGSSDVTLSSLTVLGGPGGNAVTVSQALNVLIAASTFTASGSGGRGLQLVDVDSATVSDSYVAAATAVYVNSSSNVLVERSWLAGTQAGLTSFAQGGSLSVSSTAVSGATGIAFLGGPVVSTFAGVAFGPGVAVNVDGSGLGASSSLTMRDATGARSGPAFETDPDRVVHWAGASFPAPAAPPAPQGTGLGVSSIAWTWGPSAGAWRYDVYSVSSGTLLARRSTQNFTSTGLAPNTAYGVRVAAVGADESNVLSAVGTAFTSAAPPTGTTATAVHATSATVRWGLNGNPLGTTAEVQRSTDAATYAAVFVGTVSERTEAGLQGCSTYYFRVRNRGFDGAYTAFDAVLSFATLPSTPLPAGELSAESLPGSRIRLTWVSSPDPGLTGYRLYYDSGTGTVDYGTPLAALGAGATAYTTGTLANGVVYRFGLRARNSCGREEGGLGSVAAAPALGSLAGVRAAIKVPASGKRVSGNRVMVMAELVGGEPERTREVRFQYRASSAAAWADVPSANLQHPNPDSAQPYFVHWDVTGLPAGDFDLRAVATDVFGSSDSAPGLISVSVDPVNFEVRETDQGGGRVKKEQTVNNAVPNTLAAAESGSAVVTKVMIPAGAVSASTTVVTLQVNPVGAPPHASDALPVGATLEVNLGNGQSLLAGGQTAALVFNYPDSDGDGVVDGTTLRAAKLTIVTYDALAGRWKQEFAAEVDQTARTVTGRTPHFSFFSLIGAASANLSAATVYPNPWKPNGGNPDEGKGYVPGDATSGVVFDNLPPSVRVTIYTLGGTEVESFGTEAGTGALQWDGRNSSGQDVASGVYFAVIKSPGSEPLVLKFGVVR